MPIKITNSYLDNLENPEKLTEIFDSLVTGLSCRVTPTGYKTWYFRYRFGDQVKRCKIAKYPTIKVAKARELARQLHVDVHSGTDPQAEKKLKRNRRPDLTFKEVAESFKAFHMKPLRDKTRAEYERIIDNELVPAFGKIAAKDLQRSDILDLLDKKAYEDESPTMANRIRARLHTIYTFAVGRDLVKENPVTAVPKYSAGENKRKRFYTEDEIRDLWNAFEMESDPARIVFKMLLICGQRSTETRYMKYENIKNGVWTIPASLSKSKREHHVPLPDLAIELLHKERQSGYVFESRPGEPLKTLKKAINRVREISGVEDFRPHDLRRTAATYMAELKIDRTTLGKILNHSGLAGDGQVTAVYDRYDYMSEKRTALSRWSRYLVSIVKDEPLETKLHNIG